jgi:hypothetical protein
MLKTPVQPIQKRICIKPCYVVDAEKVGNDFFRKARRLLKAAPKPTPRGGCKKCEKFWTLSYCCWIIY